MAESQELEIILKAKDEATSALKKLATEVNNASGKTKQFTEQSEKSGLSLTHLATAFGLGQLAVDAFRKAISTGINFLKTSVKEFSAQEQANARLVAGLKNTTKEWQRGYDELTDYASALQKTTTFADEQIISAQAMLSTFMLNSNQIKKLTPSLLDMASALEKTGGSEADLQQISILLGKAIGGEDVAGLAGALRRVGVVMTETQTEILKTGTMEERLNAITEIVAQNFGGFASETAQTYTGRLKMLRNQMGEVKEIFGEALLKGLSPFVQKLTEWISRPETIKFLQDIGSKISAFLTSLSTLTNEILPILKVAFKDTFSLANQYITDMNRGVSTGTMQFSALDVAIAPILGGILAVNAAVKVLIGFLEGMRKAGQKFSDVIEGWMYLFQEVFKLVDKIAKRIDSGFQGVKNNPTPFNFLYDQLNGRAVGGSVSAGSAYTVGERGPEIFMPSTGGNIVPNNQTTNNTPITINVGSVRGQNDIDSIFDAVSRALNRRGELAMKGVI